MLTRSVATKSNSRRITKAILASAVLASLGAISATAWSHECDYELVRCKDECDDQKNSTEADCKTEHTQCKEGCEAEDKREYEFCEDACKRDKAIEHINCNMNHTSCSNACADTSDPAQCVAENCDPARGSCLGNANQIFEMCKEECKRETEPGTCTQDCDATLTFCNIAAGYERDSCYGDCENSYWTCRC
jgi:hypothetical protein